MKTTLLATAILLLPLSAHAFERERLQRACMIEQGSLLKDRNGTPSCDQLKKLNKQSSAKRKGNAANSDKPKKAGKPKKVANGEGEGYRWNPNESRYCQHDTKGFPSQCY